MLHVYLIRQYIKSCFVHCLEDCIKTNKNININGTICPSMQLFHCLVLDSVNEAVKTKLLVTQKVEPCGCGPALLCVLMQTAELFKVV